MVHAVRAAMPAQAYLVVPTLLTRAPLTLCLAQQQDGHELFSRFAGDLPQPGLKLPRVDATPRPVQCNTPAPRPIATWPTAGPGRAQPRAALWPRGPPAQPGRHPQAWPPQHHPQQLQPNHQDAAGGAHGLSRRERPHQQAYAFTGLHDAAHHSAPQSRTLAQSLPLPPQAAFRPAPRPQHHQGGEQAQHPPVMQQHGGWLPRAAHTAPPAAMPHSVQPAHAAPQPQVIARPARAQQQTQGAQRPEAKQQTQLRQHHLQHQQQPSHPRALLSHQPPLQQPQGTLHFAAGAPTRPAAAPLPSAHAAAAQACSAAHARPPPGLSMAYQRTHDGNQSGARAVGGAGAAGGAGTPGDAGASQRAPAPHHVRAVVGSAAPPSTPSGCGVSGSHSHGHGCSDTKLHTPAGIAAGGWPRNNAGSAANAAQHVAKSSGVSGVQGAARAPACTAIQTSTAARTSTGKAAGTASVAGGPGKRKSAGAAKKPARKKGGQASKAGGGSDGNQFDVFGGRL